MKNMPQPLPQPTVPKTFKPADWVTRTQIPGWQVGVALAVILGVYWLACRLFPFGLIDDAFISLRYAKNFASGHGLVFNLGERVEGYTNFLWTLLLAPAFWLKWNAARAAEYLGLAMGGLSLLLVFFIGRQHLAPQTAVFRFVIAPLGLAVQLPFLAYSRSGMEVGLFMFWVLANVYFMLGGIRQSRNFHYAALCLALATLTRPEAPVLFAFNLVFLLYLKMSKKAQVGWGTWVAHLAIYAGIVGAYFLWRHHDYGYWLPNTYYAKMGGLSFALLQRGWDYVWTFALLTYFVFLLPGLLLIRHFRQSPRLLYLLGAACALFSAVILEGGDHLALFRFCVPVLPILALLLQEFWAYAAEGKVYEYVGPLKPAGIFFLLVAPPLAASLLSSVLLAFSLGRHNLTEYNRAILEVKLAEEWTGFGKWLKQTARGDETVALLTVGAIPFYSDLRAIDMAGLTDEHIAHLPKKLGGGYTGHEKYDSEYILKRQPQFILANHKVRFSRALDEKDYIQRAFFLAHLDLLNRPGLQQDYVYLCRQIAPEVYFCFYVSKKYFWTHQKDEAGVRGR